MTHHLLPMVVFLGRKIPPAPDAPATLEAGCRSADPRREARGATARGPGCGAGAGPERLSLAPPVPPMCGEEPNPRCPVPRSRRELREASAIRRREPLRVRG